MPDSARVCFVSRDPVRRRLELVRTAFQRPLELWLICDLALYLEEQGYNVELRKLCARTVTPRNMAIIASRAHQKADENGFSSGSSSTV